MIDVNINGENKVLQDNINISKMLEILGYKNQWLGIAINRDFIPKEKHQETIIKEGDDIEILSPIVGG